MRVGSIFFVAVVVPCILAKIEKVKEKTSETHADETKLKGKDAPEHVDHRKIFVEKLKKTRSEHGVAMESIMNIQHDKRRRFVEDLLKNVQKILLENRDTIQRIGHKASAPYPHNSEILTSTLKQLIENTALFTDLSLTFPDIFVKKLENDRKLRTLIVWAYNYAKETALFDAETLEKLNLMAQQHEFIVKSGNFKNPYDIKLTKAEIQRKMKEDEEKLRNEKNKEKKMQKKAAKGEL